MIKRMNNLDLLRIISCFTVILLHVSSIWVNSYLGNGMLTIQKENVLFPVIIESMCRFAVPVFFMLTGAFQLNLKINTDNKLFYRKSAKKIFIPTIFFSIAFFIFNLILKVMFVAYTDGNLISILSVFIDLIKGFPYYHLWYLIVISLIYIIIPYIKVIKNNLSYDVYKKFCIVYFILAMISSVFSNHILSYDIGQIFCYVGYLFIGDIIISNTKKSNKKGFILITISFIVCFFNAIIRYYIMCNNIIIPFSLVENFSPLIAMSSILIFAGFTKINISKNFKLIPSLSLYIYIFHAIILDIIVKSMIYLGLLTENSNVKLCILILFSVVSITSVCVSKIWSSIRNIIYDFFEIDKYIVKFIKQ